MELLKLSTGNIKLKPTKEEKFLIWNIPALSTCPNSTPNCRKNCYAIKSENRYPNAARSRILNKLESLESDFVDRMIHTIYSYANKKSWRDATIYFRIHESGDFYNQAYFDKWVDIANYFNQKYDTYGNKRVDIVFLAYTKSFSFVLNRYGSIPDNFIIRASIWDDTKESDLELIKAMDLPYFTAYPKDADFTGIYKCIGDCSKCKQCYSYYKDIAVEIH